MINDLTTSLEPGSLLTFLKFDLFKGSRSCILSVKEIPTNVSYHVCNVCRYSLVSNPFR